MSAAHVTFESTVKTAQATKIAVDAATEAARQSSVDAANRAYAAGGSYSSFLASITAANVAYLSGRVANEHNRQIAHTNAIDVMRAACAPEARRLRDEVASFKKLANSRGAAMVRVCEGIAAASAAYREFLDLTQQMVDGCPRARSSGPLVSPCEPALNLRNRAPLRSRCTRQL